MENSKEEFLQKMDSINEELNPKNIIIINKDQSNEELTYKTQIPNQENLGMICSIISNFFIAFGTFWTKIVQIYYPNDFKTIQFLFLRSISIIFFALFHTYITKVPLLNPFTLNLKLWFFIRTKFFWSMFIYFIIMVFEKFNSPNFIFTFTYSCFFIILFYFKRKIIY